MASLALYRLLTGTSQIAARPGNVTFRPSLDAPLTFVLPVAAC